MNGSDAPRGGTGDVETGRRRRWRQVLADRSVRTKMAVTIATAAVVAAVIGILAIVETSEMAAGSDAIYSQNLESVRRIALVRADMDATRRDVLNHAVSSTPTTWSRYEHRLAEDDAAFDKGLDAYAAGAADDGLVEQLREQWADYRKLRDEQMLPVSRSGDTTEVERIRDEILGPAGDRANTTIEQIAQREADHAKAHRDDNDAVAARARTLIIAVMTVGLGLSIGLGLFVSEAILRSIRRMSAAIDALAQCDLTASAGVEGSDEFGVMSRSLDSAMGSVRGTVRELAGTATALSAASGELSTMSAQLSGGASDAAARASGAAAAADQVRGGVQSVMVGAEQMAASIGEIAANSARAAEVSQESLRIAGMADGDIKRLDAASAEIGDVVNLITSIAEQTNLLALNATIEAARAGDAGKGFAVVASEVKDLAQETARATGDITTRIKAIQDSTGSAATAVERIGQVVNQISEFSTTIASAVEEQTATTAEITRSITDAANGSAQVSDSFSAVAEVVDATSDSAAAGTRAADELARLADKLNGLVGAFRY